LPPSILALSYFFHLIATVIWIGGLAILLLLVFPAARRTLADHPDVAAFYTRLRKQFFPLTNFSLVVLVITGFVQMAGDENYDGVLQFSNEWSRAILFKHIAIFGMVICGLVMQYKVAPALERVTLLHSRGKGDPAANAHEITRLKQREIRLTWANLILGILVLAFTAWATAL
jgi:uncharacterized membrane protein